MRFKEWLKQTLSETEQRIVELKEKLKKEIFKKRRKNLIDRINFNTGYLHALQDVDKLILKEEKNHA